MCMQNKTLAAKLEELKKIKDQQDVLTAQENTLKDELKGYLQEKEIDSYEFVFENKQYKFSNKTENQMRFDSKWFCENEEYKALYESYKKVSPVTKFRYSC